MLFSMSCATCCLRQHLISHIKSCHSRLFSSAPKKQAFEDLKRQLISNLEKDESKLNYKFKSDLLIYENPKADRYRMLGLVNIAQYLFWIYGANFAYSFYFRTPAEVRKEIADSKNPQLQKEGNTSSFFSRLKENKKRLAFGISFFAIGHLFAIALGYYCARSVRYIIIRKGGLKVRLTCFSVLGLRNNHRHHDLRLDQMSCQAARDTISGPIPIKVKDKWFYFLVDPNGIFYHPKLFDQSVGVFRILK